MLHFESFVAPWGEPGPPEAPQRQKSKNTQKMKRLGSSIGSLLGHILRALRPKVEPSSVLLRSFGSLFVESVFRSVPKQVF